MIKNKRVFVGMSGGVDSSVTAALLKEQGYDVVGVYMKNWTKSLPGFDCPWKEDFQDAKRVAVQLGIDFKVFDFEKQYKHKVVDYMIDEFKVGRTPNPDIMCNQEVKFKLFLNACLDEGADLIATGHYARVWHADEANNFEEASGTQSTHVHASPLRSSASSRSSSSSALKQQSKMYQAKDKNKDQTYFLYRITEKALSKTLFPLGEYTKPEVRKLAKKFGLATAEKKESMGICFVGKVGIKEFLSQYVKTKPGKIIDEDGKVIGEHDGAIFYTIGQRTGLGIGGGLPYYVTGKNMKKNEVYVTTNLDDENLWYEELNLTDVHWINQVPKDGAKVQVRTRHRAPLIDATLHLVPDGRLKVKLKDEIRAATPGQSAVIYDKELVLGGGIIF